jgi:hypothetical protein
MMLNGSVKFKWSISTRIEWAQKKTKKSQNRINKQPKKIKKNVPLRLNG